MSTGHGSSERLVGRVAVISPHLDDAALSLGAAIAHAARAGADVRVVTVFTNDPDDARPARPWDRTCGFATTAQAARARREEDARSCEIMGATPVWLAFSDFENVDGDGPDDDTLAAAIASAVEDADSVLVPGFPLVLGDHERLTRIALTRPLGGARLGLYVEQPYTSLRLMSRGGRMGSDGLVQGLANTARIVAGGGAARGLHPHGPADAIADLTPPLRWQPLLADRAARRLKRRASQAHASQIAAFGPLVLERIALYERSAGGEAVGWLPAQRPGP